MSYKVWKQEGDFLPELVGEASTLAEAEAAWSSVVDALDIEAYVNNDDLVVWIEDEISWARSILGVEEDKS